MPRRSSAPHHHNYYHGHAGDAHRAGRGGRQLEGYTLVHAGHRLRLGPIAFWIVVGTLVIMALWSITTATYFAFREDVLTRLVARHADMQSGYEDRIAELRARIDRISGRQLLDQEQYEQKLDQILRRQSALESRASALGSLGDVTSSIRQPARNAGEPRAAPLRGPLIKGSLIGGKGAVLLPARGDTPNAPTGAFAHGAGGLAGAITRLQASLDRVEQRQTATLNSLADTYDSKARRMRGVLAELGVDVGKAAPTAAEAMGGPLVPVSVAHDAISFERQLHRIKLARAQIARLTRTLGTIPVRKPLDGEIDLVSGFGVRTDPFTGSPAMHTGIDLHGDSGDPVRATADGTVTAAGWGGGYGRMIDVDHSNGLTTRYGHLSSVAVRVGQSIRTGQIIGKVGSTGRSTGPHLHYETRLRGRVVDPQKFLRAGQWLDGQL
jgi:murein DD-endopeptidase MepM/ murein hydrolase activator NlpD